MPQRLEVSPSRQPRETSVLHTISDTARDISALFGLQGSGQAPHTAHGQSWAQSGQQSQEQYSHLAQLRPQRVYVQAAAPALPPSYRNVSLPPQRAQRRAYITQHEQRRQPAHHALEPARPRPQPPHQHPHHGGRAQSAGPRQQRPVAASDTAHTAQTGAGIGFMPGLSRFVSGTPRTSPELRSADVGGPGPSSPPAAVYPQPVLGSGVKMFRQEATEAGRIAPPSPPPGRAATGFPQDSATDRRGSPQSRTQTHYAATYPTETATGPRATQQSAAYAQAAAAFPQQGVAALINGHQLLGQSMQPPLPGRTPQTTPLSSHPIKSQYLPLPQPTLPAHAPAQSTPVYAAAHGLLQATQERGYVCVCACVRACV